MPYVPSKKTSNPTGIVKDGKAQDRILIDEAVKDLSKEIAEKINTNKDIFYKLTTSVNITISTLYHLLKKYRTEEELLNQESVRVQDTRYGCHYPSINQRKLAIAIYSTGKAYNYEGAFLGELNYAITRLIQEIPKRLVEQGKQKKQLRYFIYVYIIASLIQLSKIWSEFTDEADIGAVFEDIKDEYKRRVNTSYEVHQIVKSGDCYDAPYHTQPVEVFKNGKKIGYIEIMLKHEDYDGKDVSGKLILDS